MSTKITCAVTQFQSACIACIRHWIQSPEHENTHHLISKIKSEKLFQSRISTIVPYKQIKMDKSLENLEK
jgi:hypothetical protein